MAECSDTAATPVDCKTVGIVAVGATVEAALVGLTLLAGLSIRTITVDELRAGTAIDLAGVRFALIAFADWTPVDGGIRVAFRIAFPDGDVETVVFQFAFFVCPRGSMTQVSSVHGAPAAVFAYRCGQDFIRVWVS